MQKTLAFLVLLMLPWAARGQALADWHYWFDTDSVPHESGKVSSQRFQLQTDVSHLPTGAHTLYVQVADTAGVFSPPFGTFFIKVPGTGSLDKLFYSLDIEKTAHAVDFDAAGHFSLDVSAYPIGFHSIRLQATDKQGGVTNVIPCLFYKVPADGRPSRFHYWFDNDRIVHELPYGQGHYLLDVSGLLPGLHFVNYFAIDGGNNRTDVQSAAFLRQPVAQNQRLHYWLEGDTIATRIDNFRDGLLIDVSRQTEGFNTIYFQMEDNGTTDIYTEHFIKIPQTEGAGDMTVVCIIDGKIAAEEMLPNMGGVIKWNMDVSTTDVGLHKALFQVITPSGAGSSIAETYFLRTLTNAEMATMQCSYTIDGFKHYTHRGTLVNGVFHFDLPVGDMEDGLHRMDYILVADNGVTTTQGSAWFFKIPVGGNAVTQYDYWLNNKNDEVQSVTLDVPTDPFQLIRLLPVTNEPIRSSCFHFDSKSGKPMMYAKNDIHFRFHDKSGRWADADNRYVDYSVSREVMPVGELQATQTFAKVAENDVRWYTVQLAPGDSVAFKLNQAGTIQVFAPSGAEVFKTSESASVKWGGIHTWENGTYYLAVHDVTGSQSTMKLDYMHMDKYDVVDWDVHRVGNGGCSTITFKGNGFRDLYTVDLIVAPGDTIRSVDVSHDSDAETAVTFDFSGATMGEYNAVFHFTEEDKHIANVVTVEEAVDIELAKTVTFPSAFPHGLSTTYTVKITNMGNMTAYSVPIFTWIMNKRNKDGIYHIEYEGLDLPGIFDGVDMDSLSVSERAELQALSDEIGDEHYFKLFRVEDEDSPGDSVWVRSNYFFTNIAPYETKTIQLTLSANEGVWAYFTVPEDWPSYGSEQYANGIRRTRVRFKDSSLKDKYCCVKEKVECNASIMANVAGLINLLIDMLPNIPHAEIVKIAAHIVDCEFNILETAVSVIGDFTCGKDDETEKDFWEKVKSLRGTVSNTGVIWSCLEAFVPKARAAKWVVKWIRRGGNTTDLSDIMGLGKLRADCEKAYSTPKPGCPPCTTCGGGGGSGGGSWDPNDIFGYLSKSGSHFINDLVSQVNYTIEFENDTTLAMAAAHEIVIKDTLDSRYFDLNTFTPMGIRIGSREVFLDEADVVTSNSKTTFVKTIDMRPEINAIAQVEGEYNQKKGIAEWRFTSLDPMTMEPAEDVIQGILPVNYNGTSGIGEVMFEIGVKSGKNDGAEIKNRAGIVFDANTPILTPTWTNIVDAVAPSSVIDNSWMVNDSTLRVTVDAFDARSGVWKYTWYVQAGENAPWWKEGETESPQFDYHIFEGIDYGFCVLATDSAGNVEQKVIQRERGFKTYGEEFDEAVGLSPLPASPDGEEKAIYDLSGRRQAVPKENQVNIIDKKKVLIR